MKPWALIAGGGTAGHVLPGLALARALVERGREPAAIRFVGTSHGLEARLVPEAGFEVTLLSGRGFERRLTAANLSSAWGLLRAVVRALVLLARQRPAVVVSLGGYASVPCGLAAAVLRVPLVVVEQNAVPGAANRLLARFARASAVSFPGTPLPRAQVTGNPVRPEILAVDRAGGRLPARAALGLPPDRRVLAVFGGSLGARRINLAVVDAAQEWEERADLAVHHVVGERDWDLVGARARPPASNGLVYQRVRYEQRMDLVMAAADLALCRAGATSVAELLAVGLPAVLVPLPGAPGDHQTANARVLEGAGAAICVPDAELDGARVVKEVDALLASPDRLADMSRAATGYARRDAARQVAALVEREAARG